MKNLIREINWQKVNNLVPAIIQDDLGNSILMLGYMNQEALQKSIQTNKVWFYSRTKKRLWQKGESSGNYLTIKNIHLDCDNDSLLIKVEAPLKTCHLGQYSCFSEEQPKPASQFVGLFETISSRKKLLPKGSYTSSLFQEGLNKICIKVAEEFGEVIKAATKETKQRLIEEAVDLIYHMFVLLVEKQITLSDIENEIKQRIS